MTELMLKERMTGERQGDQPIWYVTGRWSGEFRTWGPFYARNDAELVVVSNPEIQNATIVKRRLS